jgi:hypothetical protein
MAARANSVKPDDLSGATVEMIREMVKRAEAKLSSLQSRRTQIRRRLQALHHLSRIVAAGIAIPSIDDLDFEAHHSAKQQALTKAETQSLLDEPRRNALSQPTSSPLRRACRIALMESDEAESYTQILHRIPRRESVSFKDHRNPLQEVTAELNRMVADCEAITFGVGNAQQWQLNRAKNQGTDSLAGDRLA